MELAAIALQQFLMMMLMMLTGVISTKTGIVEPRDREMLSRLLVNVILPCALFKAFLIEYDPSIMRGLLISCVAALVILVIGMLLTMPVTKRLGLRERPILNVAAIYSNCGYMGFPLVAALFGDEGLIYAGVFNVVYNLLLFSQGISMLDETPDVKEVLLKIVRMPLMIAIGLGLIRFLTGIQVPSLLRTPIETIGEMTGFLSMFIIGIVLAGTDFPALLGTYAKELTVTILLRLIVIPFVCVAGCAALHLGGLPIMTQLVLQACPCAAMAAILAVRYRYNEQLVTGTVVLSTLVSIITLPAWTLVISIWL